MPPLCTIDIQTVDVDNEYGISMVLILEGVLVIAPSTL